MSNHQKVVVKVGNREAQVDEMLAPLIAEMWVAWINVEASCQQWAEGSKYACLHFPTVDDLRKFLNIIGNPTDWNKKDSLYMRTMEEGELPWEYMLMIKDQNMGEDYRFSYFIFSPGVKIPQSDIPLLVDNLREYNSKNHAV